MPGRLQDEVERSVDQLVRLSLESAYRAAWATDQWMSDLNDADSVEQVYLSYRCFLVELQRVVAHDLACRFDIAAGWFGATPLRRAAAEAMPALPPAPEFPAKVDQARIEPSLLEPQGVMMLTAAALDATSLKALRGALQPPRPAKSSTDPVSERARAVAIDASVDTSPAGSARAPLRAGSAARVKRRRA